MSVHYRVLPADPAAHLFEVELTVAAPDPAGQELSLPAWIPGSYMIRDFARHIVEIAAEGTALTKLDKQRWRAAAGDGPLVVRYRVYAWDLSVRGAHLDGGHGYFNGPCLFLRVHGRDREPCTVELLPPAGEEYRDWRVATTLPADGAEPCTFGRYRAADYDELIDHPVEMGRFDSVAFEAAGVRHELVFTGRHHGDLERIARDLRPVCETHVGLFGELPVRERYLFQVTVTGDGYGGLEHRNSTSLICSRNDLPRPGDKAISEEYRAFLGLASHEYFHLWNVKRIRPAAFTPYRLEAESHTRLLWAFEGITSYYDDLALVRAGVIEPQGYLELLGQTLTRVRRTPGRLRQTVAESSFDAWTKLYQQDENGPNSIISYYTKGAWIALALDLTLRRDGGSSLDELMRALWRRYGRSGEGVPEDGVERLAEELGGASLAGFFDRALRSTEEPPLEELLAWVGVELRWRPAESAKDKGGKPSTKSLDELAGRAELGARVEDQGGFARLAAVFDGGAARAAGLSAGDLLVACDGLRVESGKLETLLGRYRPGDTVTLHAFRRDELLETRLTLQAPAVDTAVLSLIEDPGVEVAARRRAWLGRVAGD